MNQKFENFPVPGMRLGTVCAGIRHSDRRDLVIIELAQGTHTAAVFTRNAFCAAPVTVARKHLSSTSPRYLVINTGYANAGTGQAGIEDASACCKALAGLTNCATADVLPFSTGIIGEPLPVDSIIKALPDGLAALSETGWENAAWGIMTTDTVPKLVSRQVLINGVNITVTGMAKGAGMIRPDMATMLAFIATDAELDMPCLQQCLQHVTDKSFNRITVDGDTSTNDACLIMATGQSGLRIDADGAGYITLYQVIEEVCITLAKDIIRDAEGATKLITIVVEEGQTEAECLAVAYTIAHSPLVKTAFFAGDPNWGRILAAVGRAKIADLAIDKIDIHLDEVCIVKQGARALDYTEAMGVSVMSRDEIVVRVSLGRGEARTEIWTCDLSHEYIRINAEYRT